MGKTFPPDIYDETVFPSLTRKIVFLESGVNVPNEFSSNISPRSLIGITTNKGIQNPTANTKTMSNNDRLNEKQHEKKIFVNLVKEEVIKEKLDMAIVRKYQPKENGKIKRTDICIANYKKWLLTNPHLVVDYQGHPQWMIPRSPWAVTNLVSTHPLDLSYNRHQLYRYILRYVPSRKRLEELGYPLVSVKNPNQVVIIKKESFTKNNKKNEVNPPNKFCERCGATFLMETGEPCQMDECVYHWGKVISTGVVNVHLTCCKGSPTSRGCTTAQFHVWNGLYYGENWDLEGFVRTGYVTSRAGSQIFGLDCEMCFTTEGLELIKVALVDLFGNQVYYSLVYPENEVIDFNTRFSGVSRHDFLINKGKYFKTVQEEVLKIIQTDTIIIGHGLENDLRALKIIHSLVVDTSIVYPHPCGLPSRRPLKDIAEDVLGRKIQEGGHNPVEDANVCVELILKQLKVDFNVHFNPDLK